MNLEKEIISTKFENNYQKSVVNIIYTYNWITNLLNQRLGKYNISLPQYTLLRILRGQHHKPATVNLIKERMLDKKSDVSRIVERLVKKGLVMRCSNQTDRRTVDIRISDKGMGILSNRC